MHGESVEAVGLPATEEFPVGSGGENVRVPLDVPHALAPSEAALVGPEPCDKLELEKGNGAECGRVRLKEPGPGKPVPVPMTETADVMFGNGNTVSLIDPVPGLVPVEPEECAEEFLNGYGTVPLLEMLR